jgi:hypothetical protein
MPGEDAPLEVSVYAQEVSPFERSERREELPAWHATVENRAQIDALAHLIGKAPGTTPVVLHIGSDLRRLPKGIANEYYVKSELESIFGTTRVWQAPLEEARLQAVGTNA